MNAMGGANTGVLAVSPYLYYEDLGAALNWLEQVFGFTEDVRYVDSTGTVQEAEMLAGDTRIMMGGCAPGPGDGPGQLLIVYVADVDAQYARLLKSDVKSDPPVDQPYGPRTCSVTDPWGYKWSFWQQTEREIELPEDWTEIRQ